MCIMAEAWPTECVVGLKGRSGLGIVPDKGLRIRGICLLSYVVVGDPGDTF